MGNQSIHGRQPFTVVLFSQGKKTITVGRELGFDPGYAARVGNGRATPSPEFRAAICAYLGMSEQKLFTKSARTTPYKQRKNARGLQRNSGGAE